MASPVKLIDILSENTQAENLCCDECGGAGEMSVSDPETGTDVVECGTCLGTGYNQLGLILQGILQPPPEGYGPVALREALADYLAREQMIRETQQAIADAQKAIAETQEMIAKAQSLLIGKKAPKQRSQSSEARRRIS